MAKKTPRITAVERKRYARARGRAEANDPCRGWLRACLEAGLLAATGLAVAEQDRLARSSMRPGALGNSWALCTFSC
jgi:hypothetical protein